MFLYLEGGRLKGIVTVSDLLGLVGYGIDRPARPHRADLRVPPWKQHRAHSAW